MKMKAGIVVLVVGVLLGGSFLYQKATADTYEGMSVIAEQEKDIPLYEGLKPKRSNYVVDGNKEGDLLRYYLKVLPEIGWERRSVSKWVDGFEMSWVKDGFSGELYVNGHYEKEGDQTVLYFDQRAILTATTWVDHVPSSLCVENLSTSQPCITIKDKDRIQDILTFINEAPDTETVEKHEQTYRITIEDQSVNVYYKNDAFIYLESEQGIKRLKPDPAFLEAIGVNLSETDE